MVGGETKTSTKTKTKPEAMTINPDQDNFKNVNMLSTFSPLAAMNFYGEIGTSPPAPLL
jgi:hypothetical protein